MKTNLYSLLTKTNHLRVLIFIEKILKSLGSTPYDIDYKKHDLLMSQTSHIAHLMAFIFVQSLPQSIITKNLPILLGRRIKNILG